MVGIKVVQPITKSPVSHPQNGVEQIEEDDPMGKSAPTSTYRRITPNDLQCHVQLTERSYTTCPITRIVTKLNTFCFLSTSQLMTGNDSPEKMIK